jgi:hypothetical protein
MVAGSVRRLVRRLLPLALAALAAIGCTDDAGESASTTTEPTTTTTTTPEPIPQPTNFVTEDLDALCAALGGLADIDPDADPTAADVQRLRDIAASAPPGVAEPLHTIADFAQSLLDGEEPADEGTVVESAVILISYGNEACDIDVPLFDTLAGV